MIGEITTKTSTSGTRPILMMLRRAILLGVGSGDGEEHVVEGGAAQSDVFDRDALGVERAQHAGEHLGATGDRSHQRVSGGVVLDLTGGVGGEHMPRLHSTP